MSVLKKFSRYHKYTLRAAKAKKVLSMVRNLRRTAKKISLNYNSKLSMRPTATPFRLLYGHPTVASEDFHLANESKREAAKILFGIAEMTAIY